MRVQEGGGSVVRYKRDWHGNLRKRIIRRALPRRNIDAGDMYIADCSDDAMRIYTLFQPVASWMFFTLFSRAFGEGNCSFNIQELAAEALQKCANDEPFKLRYILCAKSLLGQWLAEFRPDHWDFGYHTVRYHGLSSALLKEGCLYVRYFLV